MSTDARVQRFIDALAGLEARREVAPLAALFSDEAEIANSLMTEPMHGRAGAESFWSIYRHSFDSVSSTFLSVIAAGDQAALEWESRGKGPAGEPFSYRGVSLLTFSGERISRFAAYFDAGALGHQLGSAARQRSVW